MKRVSLGAAVIVLACAVLFSRGAADQPPATEPAPPKVVTRLYDIGYLLVDLPNFTNAPDFNLSTPGSTAAIGGSDVAFGTTSGGSDEETTTTRERLDNLLQLIQDIVEPDSWRDKGGQVGSLRELRGLMIVTHTEAVQQQIATLLDQVSKIEHAAIRISAHWIRLAPGELDGCMVKGGAVGEFDRAALQRLARQPGGYRTEITSISGRRVFAVAASQQAYVAADGTASVLNAGAVLDIVATISPAKEAIVTLRPQVAEARPTAVGAGSATTRPATMPIVTLQDVRTSVRMPLGTPILIGGMTREITPDGTGSQLYLVLEVTAADRPAKP